MTSLCSATEVWVEFKKKQTNPRLTFDLGGELSGVPGLKQLQLPVQVTDGLIDVPGAQSCEPQSSGVRHGPSYFLSSLFLLLITAVI